MDDVKAMIKAATEKDAAGFQDAFATVMNDKVSSALADKYDSMFGAAEEAEEVEPEQLEDISAEEEDEHD